MTKTKHIKWRDHLKVHPAAETFPLLSKAELEELAANIEKHGLQTPIVFWRGDKPSSLDGSVLDGRNRLDALEQLGLLCLNEDGKLDLKQRAIDCRFSEEVEGDPYALVLSQNLHRRHLNPKQRREIVATALKANPAKSNRRIAKETGRDDKTVAKVRGDLEATAEIPAVDKTVGADGRVRGRRQGNATRSTTFVWAGLALRRRGEVKAFTEQR